MRKINFFVTSSERCEISLCFGNTNMRISVNLLSLLRMEVYMKNYLALMISVSSFALIGCVSESSSYWKADFTDEERDKQYIACFGPATVKYPERIGVTGETNDECTTKDNQVVCTSTPIRGDLNANLRSKEVQSCMESRGYTKKY